jgi:ABC-type multidrug transport system fused ATPase/permease subunit
VQLWRVLPEGFRERCQLLGKLRDAGWALGLLLGVMLLAAALIPAASAVTMGLLVGALERGPSGQAGLFGRALLPLVVFTGAMLVSHVLDAAEAPLVYAVKSRIDGAHRAAVTRLAAATPTLAALERPRTRDLIRLTAADPENWTEHTPGDGALAQLNVLFSYLGVASSCAVLAAFSPVLVPGILIPAWAARVLRARRLRGNIRRWVAGIPDGRRSSYWKEVATSPAEGKELRVFGFGRWAVNRSQYHRHAMYDPMWRKQIAAVKRGPLITTLLCGVPLAVSYGLVAAGTTGGHHSVATETAVLAAGYSVCVALSLVLGQLNVEGALPSLRALEEFRGALAEPPTGPLAEPAEPTRPPAEPTGSARPTRPPAEQAAEFGDAPRLVRFERVCFSYPGNERAVLRDLDLEIRPGELLAIVGLNGAGKSTLIKLLAGLYRPSSGRVTVDGTDIFAGLTAWRRRISLVFQDFAKYQLSARDNVTLDPGADRDTLDAAARESGLDAVLAELPAGWDTPLARSRTGGVDLSGGQWQQVVLARALYAAASGAWLLVLDEPTAHLDVRTEFELFGRLAGRAGDLSVVLISHRLSTVRQADRIVLLDGCRITESGTHDELMARDGRYAAMFALQAERFRLGYDDGAGRAGRAGRAGDKEP